MPSYLATRLHHRILAVIGTLGGLLVAGMFLGSCGRRGLDGLGSVLAGVSIAFATVAYLAVSTILANMAKNRRDVVLAHVATPFVLLVLGALVFAR